MLLYAGITSFIFKYSNITNKSVTKLKQRSQSAWNFAFSNLVKIIKLYFSLFLKEGLNILLSYSESSSETLRNKTYTFIKKVSIHVPTHLKPTSDKDFGDYLAGIIDAAGNFTIENSNLQLVIKFNSLDASLAYYIKERLGFGTIRKVKDKNAFLLIVAARKGMEKVINLINGKIRTEIKFNQITNNIFNHAKYAGLKQTISLKLNTDKDLKNHWLVGFSDAEASFQIKVINRSNKVEVRLNFQLVARPSARSLQKKDTILLLIKDFLGGLVTYNKLKNEYIYSSGSYGSAKNVINCFDYYHLLSSKHINFLKWRKTYIGLQKGDLSVIKKYSKTLSQSL